MERTVAHGLGANDWSIVAGIARDPDGTRPR